MKLANLDFSSFYSEEKWEVYQGKNFIYSPYYADDEENIAKGFVYINNEEAFNRVGGCKRWTAKNNIKIYRVIRGKLVNYKTGAFCGYSYFNKKR